jgi:hypothetical protein
MNESGICGSVNTATGNPCRRKRRRCPYHQVGDENFNTKEVRRKNGDLLRYEKLLQGRLLGMNVRQAALYAGYAESTSKGKIYQIIKSVRYQARIQELREQFFKSPVTTK